MEKTRGRPVVVGPEKRAENKRNYNREYMRRKYREQPEKIKATKAKWRSNPENRARERAYTSAYERRRRLDPVRKTYARAREAGHRALIVEAKNVPCTDCGGKFPFWVMDFDHRDQADKKFIIARGASRNREVLQAEMAKCDVICANCHRTRTHERRQHITDNGKSLNAS